MKSRGNTGQGKKSSGKAGSANDEFLRNFTHELKTPLSVILTDISIVQQIYPGLMNPDRRGGMFKDLVDSIERNAVQMRTSIENVLEVERLDSSRYKREKIDVGALVSGVAGNYKPVADGKGLSLESSSEPNLFVTGDPHLLAYMLSDLAGNAVKFSNSGKVEIRAVKKGEKVSISVIDSGIGISDKDKKRVFQKFFKADSRAPGTGLGLYTAQQIAAGHNGKLFFVSKAGKGSTFTAELPVHKEK